MKKSLAVIAVIVLVALLPVIGNKAVKNAVEDRLASLQNEGLAFKLQKEDKSYLKTHLFYTVTVKDEEKFMRYLQEFSSQQLPAYTKSLVDGVEFGVDITYSNIPMSEKVVLEFYPTKFSESTMDSLQKEDKGLYELISDLLTKKALFYHIEYDVTSGEFNGYMKDLDEHFKVDGKNDVHFVFKGAKADGKGQLLAPERFHSHVDKIVAKITQGTQKLDLDVEGFASSASFASKTSYVSSSKIEKFRFTLDEVQDGNDTKVVLNLDKFAVEGSSDTQGEDADFYLKTSLKKGDMIEGAQVFHVENFRFDGALEGVEKESFLKLQKIFQEQRQNVAQQEMEEAFMKIFSHGAKLKIAQFSLDAIETPQTQKIDGFTISLDAQLKPDPDFAIKLKKDPNLFAKNIQARSKLDFSKEFYAFINTVYPLDLMFAPYKEEKNDHVFFDVEYDAGVLKINDKLVK